MISLLVIYMIMIKVSAVTSTLWQGLEKEVTLGASHVSWRTNWTQGKTLKSVPWLWMTNGEFKGLAFVLVFQKKLDENSVDLRKTVIGDERWCFLCDPETKRQSLRWKITTFPTSPKAHMSKSQIAGLLLCLSAICRTFRCGGQESIQLITCTHTHAHAHTHTCWWPTRCTAAVHSEESIQLITHTHAHVLTAQSRVHPTYTQTHTHTCWWPTGCSELHSRVHPAHLTHTHADTPQDAQQSRTVWGLTTSGPAERGFQRNSFSPKAITRFISSAFLRRFYGGLFRWGP